MPIYILNRTNAGKIFVFSCLAMCSPLAAGAVQHAKLQRDVLDIDPSYKNTVEGCGP